MKLIAVAIATAGLAFAVPAKADAWYHWSWIHGVEKTHHWYNGPTRREQEVLNVIEAHPHVHEPHLHHEDHHVNEHRHDESVNVRRHDDGDLNGDGVETIGEAEEIAHRHRLRCDALQLEYLFRHGADKPSELRGMSGCRLWEADAHYHEHLNEPTMPTAESLIMEAAA